MGLYISRTAGQPRVNQDWASTNAQFMNEIDSAKTKDFIEDNS